MDQCQGLAGAAVKVGCQVMGVGGAKGQFNWVEKMRAWVINGFPFLSEARDGRRKSPALEEAGRRFSKPADLQIHVWSFPKTHTHTHTHNNFKCTNRTSTKQIKQAWQSYLQEYTVTTADLFNIIVYIKDELQIFFHMPKQSGTFKKKKKLYS